MPTRIYALWVPCAPLSSPKWVVRCKYVLFPKNLSQGMRSECYREKMVLQWFVVVQI